MLSIRPLHYLWSDSPIIIRKHFRGCLVMSPTTFVHLWMDWPIYKCRNILHGNFFEHIWESSFHHTKKTWLYITSQPNAYHVAPDLLQPFVWTCLAFCHRQPNTKTDEQHRRHLTGSLSLCVSDARSVVTPMKKAKRSGESSITQASHIIEERTLDTSSPR